MFIFLTAYAAEMKIESLFNGKKELEAQYVQKEERNIAVWRPVFYDEKANSKYPWYKDAVSSPYKFFANDLKESLKKYENITNEFNLCVAKKEWPEKTECLSIVDFCFGLDNSCDFYISSYLDDSNCSGTSRKCIKTSERAFNLYAECLSLKRHISFSFYPFGPKAEKEDFVGIRIGPPISKKDKYSKLSCDLGLYKGKLSVIDINEGRDWEFPPSRPFPRSNFKSKSGFY